MTSLYNKNILIINAGTGINRACAIACAKEKANIIAIDSRKTELADVEREIGNMKSNIRTYLSAFSSVKTIDQTLKDIYKNHDRVDVLLIGNLDSCMSPFLKTDAAHIEKLQFSAITVSTAIVRYVYERMLSGKESVIVGLPPFNIHSGQDSILDACANEAWNGLFSGLSKFSSQTKAPVTCITVTPSSKIIDEKNAAAVILDALSKNKTEVRI